MSRNTEAPLDPRERFSLYALCPCSVCDATGKVNGERCPNPDCRGEGRERTEVATTDSPEGVGVALVTLAREGHWRDEDGNPCQFGLLDRMGEEGQRWLVLPWPETARTLTSSARQMARKRHASG